MLKAGLKSLMLVGFASIAAAEAPALMKLAIGSEEFRVNAKDISIAEAAPGSFGGVSLNVKLDSRLDLAIASFTEGHIGEKVGFYICDQLMIEPMLQVPLMEANFVISLEDRAEAERLAVLLRDGTCPEAAGS